MSKSMKNMDLKNVKGAMERTVVITYVWLKVAK